MTDPQTPRPTLKLNLKPAIIETLGGKIPKQTIVVPDKVEPKSATGNNRDKPDKKVSPQAPVANKPVPTPPKKEQQKVDKKPKQPQKPKKEKIPPPVLEPYDFFEVYGKLHADFREIISLKNPKALAIGIKHSINEASGLSRKNTKMWMAEYLRRCSYYKKAHIAGANRYNLQGEITGIVTQEECDARQALLKTFKKKPKKVQQSPQETNQ